MFGTHDLWLFILSALLLNITPGPDTALVVARSTQMGLRGGVAASFGIAGGIVVHIAAAAIGLSALIAASATAFTVIKYVGAAYLIYIGLRMILSRSAAVAESTAPAQTTLPLRSVFWQGFFSNALNPKVAIFFLAFLPQFVSNDTPSKAIAFLFLGVVFIIGGTLWSLVLAAVTAHATSRLKATRRFQRLIDSAIGAMFVALGIRLALVER
ncbi:LysE family translocator [Pseudolabrys sp. FHR47]|uniref:LysE family translocator n=1 Tax=Pseudolabrys sp. FHR47 TaxID=2562284 RepID=UPI0010BE77B8|nr:LysE family translocator [Pseudolabrys sp. FHR47]